MEVKIISREMIKPFSPKVYQKKPFKLCLFDQLSPSTYTPLTIFFSKTERSELDAIEIVAHFKNALSITLTLLYPFSGRIKDNIFIEDFDEGVPFVEAQVNRTLEEYLESRDTESFHKFLPRISFLKEPDNVPLVAFQVTRFACGGVATSGCFSHKLGDGVTSFFFSRLLFSFIRNGPQQVAELEEDDSEISIASLVFPPITPHPEKYLSIIENFIFKSTETATRRFVFRETAITTLRQQAQAKSRVRALSCFIWQRFMAACRVISAGSISRPSVLRQIVNIRPRTNPPLPDGAIGNLTWSVVAASNPELDLNLHELSKTLNKAIEDVDHSCKGNLLQGERGLESIFEELDQLEDTVNGLDTLRIASWCGIGLEEVGLNGYDPVWLAPIGKLGCYSLPNLAILIEPKRGKGIEAWLTLDENIMAVLENDLEFLTYASAKMILEI